MLKVNNKKTKMTSMTLTLSLFVNFEHISDLFSNDSIVDFEQVNVSWVGFEKIHLKIFIFILTIFQVHLQNQIKHLRWSFLQK